MLKLFFCDDNAQQLALFSDFGKKAILLKEEWTFLLGMPVPLQNFFCRSCLLPAIPVFIFWTLIFRMI